MAVRRKRQCLPAAVVGHAPTWLLSQLQLITLTRSRVRYRPTNPRYNPTSHAPRIPYGNQPSGGGATPVLMAAAAEAKCRVVYKSASSRLVNGGW